MLFIYTICSAYAFLVNMYLGLRLFYKKGQLLFLRKMARNVYIISCTTNWLIHIYLYYTHYSDLGIEHLAYLVFLYFIIMDDIILISWLCNCLPIMD